MRRPTPSRSTNPANAYITGHTLSNDFPTQHPEQPASGAPADAFVAKIDPSGSALIYSTYLGGTGYEGAYSIAIDPSGNAYVTGYKYLGGFPATQGAYQTASGGGYDAFITKLNANGSSLMYSTYFGGTNEDVAFGVAVDSLGNAYVTGHTESGDFPMQNALQPTFAGGPDGFVTKLNPAGSALVYSTYFGGNGSERAHAIAVDLSGNAYVTGVNALGGLPLKDALQTEYHGGFDGFVAKFSPNGGLVYSTYLGGGRDDQPFGIAVDPLGTAYVAGSTGSMDFPTTPGAYQETNAGIFDAFVAKISAPSVGKITGGGSIAVSGDIGTFSFTVQCATAGALIEGDLQYFNRATRAKVRSVTFNSFSVTDTTVAFGGTCVSNGVPCTFTVEVTDNGEPGVADIFSISVSGGPKEGGTLRSGNIQIR